MLEASGLGASSHLGITPAPPLPLQTPDLLNQTSTPVLFDFGPSRVGPQTSRPLGASFRAPKIGLKYCVKIVAILCDLGLKLFDAKQYA